MAKIGDFLIKLSDDPVLRREFNGRSRDTAAQRKAARDRVMTREGLTKPQREMLERSDLTELRAEIQRENPGKAVFLALARPIH